MLQPILEGLGERRLKTPFSLPLRPYAPNASTGARGSFGWLARGCHVERSARAIEEHRRSGAMT